MLLILANTLRAGAEAMDQRSLIDNICFNNIEHGGAAQEVVFFGTEKT